MSPFIDSDRLLSVARVIWKKLRTPVSLKLGVTDYRTDYKRVLFRSITLSGIVHIAIFLVSNRIDADKLALRKQNDLMIINQHMIEVRSVELQGPGGGGRPGPGGRIGLAKQMLRIPVIGKVQVDIDSVNVPKIEMAALDIGDIDATGPGAPGGYGGGSGGGFGGGIGSGIGNGIGDGSSYTRRPELVMLVPPVYPKDAERDRIEGTVELRIHVTESGTVDQVEVQSSSGLPSMDEAAVKAAAKTRFRPAITNGRRVGMWIIYPIQFALNRR